MNRLAISAIFLVALLAINSSAHSEIMLPDYVDVNYMGTDYRVTVMTGSFTDMGIGPAIKSSPWYGDSGVAEDFVTLVGDAFALPNTDAFGRPAGPYFAFTSTAGGFMNEVNAAFLLCEGSCFSVLMNNVETLSDPNYELTYAKASVAPVPVPAAIWLFGSAIAGLVWRSRKARQSVT